MYLRVSTSEIARMYFACTTTGVITNLGETSFYSDQRRLPYPTQWKIYMFKELAYEHKTSLGGEFFENRKFLIAFYNLLLRTI